MYLLIPGFVSNKLMPWLYRYLDIPHPTIKVLVISPEILKNKFAN